MKRVSVALILLTAAAPAHAAADAAGFEDLKLLDQRVVGALDADVGTPGGPVAPIDSRLKLKPCPTPATIDPPALGAVAVRCTALGWRIRVPLVKQPAPQAAVAVAVQAAPQPLTPVLIKRGDPVEVVAGQAGFTVSVAAVAQEDGRLGGRIRVRPDDRDGGILIGQVEDSGRVRINSF